MSAEGIDIDVRLALHAAAQNHNILRTDRAEGIGPLRNHFLIMQHFFNTTGNEFTFNFVVGDERLRRKRFCIQAMQLHRTAGGFGNDRSGAERFIIAVAQTADALGHAQTEYIVRRGKDFRLGAEIIRKQNFSRLSILCLRIRRILPIFFQKHRRVRKAELIDRLLDVTDKEHIFFVL